jgi:transposase
VDEAVAWHRSNEVSRRLAIIPGVGPITASTIAATVVDANQFSSGRQFAAWLGLVPQQRSSGGKERLGGIETRRWVPPPAAHSRRPRYRRLAKAVGEDERSMDWRPTEPSADERRNGGIGQQECEDCLGVDEARA